jgi:phospholipid/cholesterol/gamma-HCH transport system substrate-binding protein
MSTTAKSVAGALSLCLLLTFGYLGSQYALGAFDDTYTVNVVLGELGQGIVSGSDVKIRGVLVGSVGEIRLGDDLRAVAELVLEPDVRVPERAVFAATGKTLLGEKQIEITFDGSLEQGPHLADGATVSDPARVVELQDVLGELAELFEAIDTDDLAVVINDGIGAFDGQGPVIARSIDEGRRATDVFSRSLDDQVPAIRDLSLVAEALGPAGGEFNRLGGELLDGLPTITDNQEPLRELLLDLQRFSTVLDATLVVDRPRIDRMIVEGDNVTRMLFAYHPEVGQLLSGIVNYMSKFSGGGYEAPDVTGQAAPFQLMITLFDENVCESLPPELTSELPVCGEQGRLPVPDLPVPDLPVPVLPNQAEGPGAQPPLVTVPGPPGMFSPEVPQRGGIDAIVRGALLGGEDGR